MRFAENECFRTIRMIIYGRQGTFLLEKHKPLSSSLVFCKR